MYAYYIALFAHNTTSLAGEGDLSLSDSLTCNSCLKYLGVAQIGLVVNSGVLQVGPVDQKGTTNPFYSLQRREQASLHFVHLTHGCFVFCQAGACTAA